MRKLLLILCATTFWATNFSAAQSVGPAASDGLVAIPSKKLDQVYLLPKGEVATYRKVMIDPAQVSMQKGWLKSVNDMRDVTRWILGQDVRRITEAASVTMGSAVADGFKSQGYEIVTQPGPGVLRLSPSVPDLWVNAPDVQAADPARFLSVDAGTATLILEARDSVSGKLLGRIVDRDTARQTFRLNRTTTASNVFWFEALVRWWATNCAKEFMTAQGQS
jgi:uncharacterized protein DUF3313